MLCTLKSTADTDERFRLIFDAYDADGGGTISATELMKIAHEKGNEMGESLELVKNVMSTIDADGTGQVDFDEFLTACKDTPLLLDAFEQLLPSPSLLKRHVSDLNKIPPGGTSVTKTQSCTTHISTLFSFSLPLSFSLAQPVAGQMC